MFLGNLPNLSKPEFCYVLKKDANFFKELIEVRIHIKHKYGTCHLQSPYLIVDTTVGKTEIPNSLS